MPYENIPKLVDHVATTPTVLLPPVRVRPSGPPTSPRRCAVSHTESRSTVRSSSLDRKTGFLDELAREVLGAAHDSRRGARDQRPVHGRTPALRRRVDASRPEKETRGSCTQWRSHATTRSASAIALGTASPARFSATHTDIRQSLAHRRRSDAPWLVRGMEGISGHSQRLNGRERAPAGESTRSVLWSRFNHPPDPVVDGLGRHRRLLGLAPDDRSTPEPHDGLRPASRSS
jgi:hypothetical protein